MGNHSDISLAMSVEDLTLLECAFHAEAPLGERALDRKLLVQNPDRRFSLDVKRRKNVLRAMIDVQFGLFDENTKVMMDGKEEPLEVVHFGLIAGVVVSSPLMGDAAIAPRHLAGSKAPETHRDEKMERAMRVEAIKAVYSLAMSKMVEMSAMSPLGTIVLPLLDADELLDDISKKDEERASDDGNVQG